MGRGRRRHDVARLHVAVDLQRTRAMGPQPGQVRADDGVDLVLDPLELELPLRAGRRRAQRRPPLVPRAAPARAGDAPWSPGAPRMPPGGWRGRAPSCPCRGSCRAGRRARPWRGADTPQGSSGSGCPTCAGSMVQPSAARERRRARRVEVRVRGVGWIGARSVPSEDGTDLALTRPLAGRVGDDERRVDGHGGEGRGMRSEEVPDLRIGVHGRRGNERARVVDESHSGASSLPPGKVDAGVHAWK